MTREHTGQAVAALSRRGFVRLLGSLPLAGLPACRPPIERILPYVDQPPELVPGNPSWYATAMTLDGYATGVLVESREGRPIKIEGNPLHPASLGGTSVLEQASVLELYDPDRARAPRRGNRTRSWPDVQAALSPRALAPRVGARGAGLHLLLEPCSSPTDAALLDRLRERYPELGIFFYAPLAVAPWAEPRGLVRQYDFSGARVILSVNADFLASGPFQLRYARDFASGREPGDRLSRLYVFESALTVTGAAADHRFPVHPGGVAPLLRGLLAELEGRSLDPAPEWLVPLARDLAAAGERALVLAGPGEPEPVHALVAAINQALGAAGRTTWLTRSPLYRAGEPGQGIEDLAAAMDAGAVGNLLCLGVNACYDAPGSLDFAERYRRVPERFYAGLYRDETAERSDWFVPLSHYLESWGDGRAHDGTVSLIQPLIHPLYDTVSRTALLAALVGEPRTPHDLVRSRFPSEDAWLEALAAGVVSGTAEAPVRDSVPARSAASQDPDRRAGGRDPGLALMLVPDAGVHDGRFANNPWLQELPRPLTTLTWGNAAQLSPATAQRLGVGTGEPLRVERDGRSLSIPALILPGVADDTLVIPLGFGRTGGGRVGKGVGASAYPLWSNAGRSAQVSVTRQGGPVSLPLTQGHWSMQGRDLARALTAAEERRLPASRIDRPSSLHQPPPPEPAHGGEHQWAMTIDLSRCTGCSACVIACQAENNVPTVGREGVLDGREMHWLRIDQYRNGTAEEPLYLAHPMLCQHCEKAPCEYVCPVGATTHSADGLNEMTYNRCVGTRFCSNNCPYKVRRFNWFDYNAELSETERLARNPHVTVRERGVMEKCTFCVQRIREAQIGARVAGRTLAGSEVRTACQQACPSEAIRFGSLTEPESEMVRLRASPRSYDVLGELGTRPRVRYLARVLNPNPALRGPR